MSSYLRAPEDQQSQGQGLRPEKGSVASSSYRTQETNNSERRREFDRREEIDREERLSYRGGLSPTRNRTRSPVRESYSSRERQRSRSPIRQRQRSRSPVREHTATDRYDHHRKSDRIETSLPLHSIVPGIRPSHSQSSSPSHDRAGPPLEQRSLGDSQVALRSAELTHTCQYRVTFPDDAHPSRLSMPQRDDGVPFFKRRSPDHYADPFARPVDKHSDHTFIHPDDLLYSKTSRLIDRDHHMDHVSYRVEPQRQSKSQPINDQYHAKQDYRGQYCNLSDVREQHMTGATSHTFHNESRHEPHDRNISHTSPAGSLRGSRSLDLDAEEKDYESRIKLKHYIVQNSDYVFPNMGPRDVSYNQTLSKHHNNNDEEFQYTDRRMASHEDRLIHRADSVGEI